MDNKSVSLQVAVIQFEDKSGVTAFFAEYPQISVQAKNKEHAFDKLSEALLDFPELFSPDDSFELTQRQFDLVA